MFIVLTFFWCLSNSADTFHITEKKDRELMISPNGEQIAIQKKKRERNLSSVCVVCDWLSFQCCHSMSLQSM